MKRNVKNIVLSVLLSALLVSVAAGNVFASSHRGSAIYRDKITTNGLAGVNGHAGLVIENSLSEYVGCIIHMTADGYAETCDLGEFMAVTVVGMYLLQHSNRIMSIVMII